MRRHRNQGDSTPRISLFPFLAVLLCTMGALIVLLIAIARQSQLQASQPKPEEARPREGPSINDLARLVEQSEKQRDLAAERVADRQNHLGFLEDRLRQLNLDATKVQARLEQTALLATTNADGRARAEAELEQLKQNVARTESTLAELRKEAANHRPSYSIVPYDGRNKTTRRPIYIECRNDAVIFQPEGIRLSEEDFLLPYEPSNPLAAVLRSTKEYIAQNGETGDDKKAYPLLLVRPDGARSYDAVRRAMSNWGPEFGYEMVDDDWNLAFPAADPRLARVQRETLEDARMRLQALVELERRKKSRREYVVSPGGGGVVQSAGDAPSSRGDEQDDFDGAGGGWNSGGWSSSGDRSVASGAGGAGREGMTSRGGPAANNFAGNDPNRYNGQGGNRAGDHRANGFDRGNPYGDPASNPGGNPGANHGAHQSAGRDRQGSSGGGSSQEFAGAERGGGNSAVDGPRGPNAQGSSQPGQSSGGQSSAGQASGGQAGSAAGGSADASSGGGQSGSAECSMAQKRGANWSLPSTVQNSIGITRPLRVRCYADRAVIQGDGSSRNDRVISFAGKTESSVDELVGAVWQQTKSWGIAGKGMYWRPEIVVDVQAGGEVRFRDLIVLLDGSGLSVSQAAGAVVGRPPEADPRGRVVR